MRFTVPQFIEHEAKIVGPLTFKQFIFIGVAGALCFIFYFSIGKANFFLFLILSIIALSIGAGLAFLKVGGRGLPTILVNFFRFSIGSKFYIWKRGGALVTFSKGMEIKKEGKGKEAPLKSAGTSQLKKTRTKLEIETQ
jgi:hypothetical protein